MKEENKITLEDGAILVKTARNVVTEYLKDGKKITLEKNIQDKFSFNSGVFVTLNNPIGLRGCIGYPLPDKKLFNALEDASIAAAVEDPRFPSVKSEELDSITFEVTVLTPPETIIVDNPQEYPGKIKVGRDGLIVRYGYNSGLLLPQVPIEWGWNAKEFLEHTCEKAGLPRDYWEKPDIEVQKFQGIVFKEKEPKGEIIEEELSG
ncbi:MAG: TIGR00296 family protein [Nitrososphaeria archaeon]|nr:TIGR00296 family protein [Nitrosopumilaceae archaeon]NIP09469.1 TIGR00296 family protein [Nitrosopumilaceae archaeon]NIP91324.1 TIGR00296 family protein [Nitrososphaeria archaeon]NIS94334.1 TIGR00296 family protein [Nitrosopumilaceae archaeon]